MNKTNLILIVCDELTGLKHLDKALIDTLTGINKFKNKCVYFNNHYTNTIPCSAARAVLYTGKNLNHTEVTDNIQSSIPWQKSMKTVNQGVKTIGSYFLNYSSKYSGKVHLRQELDPNNYTRFKPRISTQNFMQDYDFNNFAKMGDYCYDPRGAYYNDLMVTQEILPSGTNPTKCDYYDSVNNICLDGAIPFMKQKLLTGENFLLCCNYDNPHDILYSNVDTQINTLQTPSLQITGSSLFNSINQTVGSYNDNYTRYGEIDFYNLKSVELDNCIDSTTNLDQLNIGVLTQILSKYNFYGIDYTNLNQYQQYQTAYYRCIKQVDEELNKLYDFIESNGLFENSIICLTADHGDYAGAHGLVQKLAPFYSSGLNVPLFLSYPNIPINYIGNSFDIVTSHMNLLPTLLSLSGYNLDYIKSEGLTNPFIDSNGFIIQSDYNYIFLYLSITFGPLLYYIAKNIQDTNAQNILNSKLGNYNYFTIQGFSVCTKFQLDDNFISCGYYFSLLHVYIDTIKYLHNNNLNFNIDLYNDSDELFILQNKVSNVPFAFVDRKSKLYFKMFTDPIVKQFFDEPIIIPYTSTSTYYNYIFDDPIYGSKIYAVKSYNPIDNFFNRYLTFNIVENYQYIITNKFLDSKFALIGNYNDLNILLSSDNIIRNIISEPIIIPINKSIISQYQNYISHPLLNNVIIGFNINTKYQLFYEYTKPQILSNILTKLIINNSFNIIKEIISNLSNNSIRTFIYDHLYDLNKNKKLRLPGVDYTIEQLISETFQIQLFNYGTDPQEIYNLVDSSRIYNTNRTLINLSYQKLYDSIKFNNLTNIFISLPVNYIFSQAQLDILQKTIT